MNINGTNALACLCKIESDGGKEIPIYPLPHMPVVKDLVVGMGKISRENISVVPWSDSFHLLEMNNFYEQHAAVEPWLKVDKYPEDGKEILQSPEQRHCHMLSFWKVGSAFHTLFKIEPN